MVLGLVNGRTCRFEVRNQNVPRVDVPETRTALILKPFQRIEGRRIDGVDPATMSQGDSDIAGLLLTTS